GPFARRDVARDRRGADRAALGVEDGRDGNRHFYGRAVLAHPCRVVVLDVLPAPQALEHPGELVDAVRGSEHGDRLPDHFVGGISVELRRRRVPAGDDSLQCLADDGVVGRLHHRLELRQRLFGLDTVRDVPRDTPGMNELLIFEQRVRAQEAMADRAVAVAHPDLDVAERLPARQAPRAVNRDLRIDAELRDIPAQVFIGLVAQQVELGAVGPADRAVRRRPTNAHRRALDIAGLRLVYQTDAYARQLERQTFPAAPLDPGGGRPRRVTSDRRDTPAPSLEAARHPAAGRAVR